MNKDTKKKKKNKDEKKPKTTAQSYAYKGYTSTYGTEILNSFNLEQQLKVTESAIKKTNRFID